MRRGLPHFIADYNASTDIWTRSLPALVIVYLLASLNGLDLERWSLTQNLLAAALAVVLLVVTWVATNLVRRRAPFERPARVGPTELAVFVLGPAIAPLVLGVQWVDALQAVGESLVLLGVIYLATSYGLVPMTLWALGRLGSQVFAIGQLVARALPLLSLIVVVAFLAAEVWEVAGRLEGPAYWLTLALLALAGTGLLLTRLPRDLQDLARFDHTDELRARAAGTPAEGIATPGPGSRPEGGPEGGAAPPQPGLSRREWFNVALVLLFSQGVQILMVALGVFAFLTVLGTLAIPAPTVTGWIGTDADVVWSGSAAGVELTLTTELLRVAGFLASFAGLSFTVYLATDQGYRAEFREEVVAEVRQAFAVRALYRQAIGQG